jgi:hypothetical protein
MSAAMVFSGNGTARLSGAAYPRPSVSRELAVVPAPAEDVVDAESRDWQRLAERFEDLTWQTVATASTLVLGLVSGVFVCAHFFAAVA